MMRNLLICLAVLHNFFIYGQIVSIIPSNGNAEDKITLIFDANSGNKELVGASKVYIHTGIVTDKPNGTAWKYVKGNWGKDDGIGEMKKVTGEANKWMIEFSPTVRSYYGAATSDNIYRISCVFRNADGSKKGTTTPGEYGWGTVASNSDIYINLNSGNYVQIINPASSEGFFNLGQSLEINASASADVTSMKLFLDEGSGFEEKASTDSGKNISFGYVTNQSLNLKIKVEALINGESISTTKSFNLIVKKETEIAEIPTGLKLGINYDANDPTKATLVLLAPQKDFVFVSGDFTNWLSNSDYQMKKDIDGERFWLEISGLEVGKEYAYQYWVDGILKVADPYCEKIADPWNDAQIESSVYPNLPNYHHTEFGIASVLQTEQSQYAWSTEESQWQKPDVNQLVIYELLVRDFVKSHSYKDVIDSLSYIKRLGVNAIELMPVSEFEGNDSWGYNPSFYFAPDKYYGTKSDLKKLIDEAHKIGLAVIMDIVLNHSYGQSPMVQMYFDGGKPATNNPWFNREYVGPYSWGFDFNHESPYTKRFIDDVNRHWLEEYHFDGFRFDFTKGFTNYAPGGNIDGFDQSRINILNRMAAKIWEVKSDAYVILEHWGPANEEQQLASKGMKMWRNKSYDFIPATIGNATGSFTNMDALSHIAFFDSHDERRIAEHALTEGFSQNGYDIKDTIIMMERVKMAAAFAFLSPGPKMIWMFDELGYDVSIDFNGRVGKKPLPWGNGSLKYYEDANRYKIYEAYSGILHVRNTIGADKLSTAVKKHLYTGDLRRLSFNTNDNDLVVIGNFGLVPKSINPEFTKIGIWYDYFSGDSISVTSTTKPILLQQGEWHIYTSIRLSNGNPDAVSIYKNPVTVSPSPFAATDEITIIFDAKLASPNGTNGLVGAEKVYMHAGVVLGSSSNNLSHVVGTSLDDGIGEMEAIGNEKWKLVLTPNEYFSITSNQDIYKIGMYFRDGNNANFGYGFKDQLIYLDVASDAPFVTISPKAFDANTEITITFNARQGNAELVGASKVYLHSSAGTVDGANPESTAWNHAKGNWGLDDGIGLMTKVAGEQDIWQIKLTPRTYYGLTANDFPYWIAAVFRNAAGTLKGTGTPGQLENGYIASNLDFYIKNEYVVATNAVHDSKVFLYPNPCNNFIYIRGAKQTTDVMIYTLLGKRIIETTIEKDIPLDIAYLQSGAYVYQLYIDGEIKSGIFVKN